MKTLIKKNQLMISALAIMIAIAGYLQFAGPSLEDEIGTKEVNSDDILTENYTAEELMDISDEDLLGKFEQIESLDTDMNFIVDDYLDVGMDLSAADTTVADGTLESGDTLTAEGTGIAENTQLVQKTPEAGELPGEAIFTAANAQAVLSEAKLLKEQTRARNKETLLEIINSAELTDAHKQDAVDAMVEMTQVAEKEAAAEILLEAKGYSDIVVSINGDSVDVVVNEPALDDIMRAQIEDIVVRKTEIQPQNVIISTVVP